MHTKYSIYVKCLVVLNWISASDRIQSVPQLKRIQWLHINKQIHEFVWKKNESKVSNFMEFIGFRYNLDMLFGNFEVKLNEILHNGISSANNNIYMRKSNSHWMQSNSHWTCQVIAINSRTKSFVSFNIFIFHKVSQTESNTHSLTHA